MSRINGESVLRMVGIRPTAINSLEDVAHRFPFMMGVELELEGVPQRANEEGDREFPNVRGWSKHRDESLRGGVEYVFETPKSGQELEKTVAAFFGSNVTYHNTQRCSTHVHVNAGPMTVKEVRTILAISYMLEDALFTALSAGRKWCGYCMPLTEMSPQRISDLLNGNTANEFSRGLGQQNADKYYGINVRSLQRHGTLEFRYFPGVSSQRELLDWLDYCTLVCKAGTTSSLEELGQINTVEDVENWLRTYMGKWAARLWKDTDHEYMLTCIQEILAMVVDSNAPRRAEPLLFVSKEAIRWATKNLNPKQAKLFEESVRALKVMGFKDWHRLQEQAIRFNEDADAAPAPQVRPGAIAAGRPMRVPPALQRAAAGIQREAQQRAMRQAEELYVRQAQFHNVLRGA